MRYCLGKQGAEQPRQSFPALNYYEANTASICCLHNHKEQRLKFTLKPHKFWKWESWLSSSRLRKLKSLGFKKYFFFLFSLSPSSLNSTKLARSCICISTSCSARCSYNETQWEAFASLSHKHKCLKSIVHFFWIRDTGEPATQKFKLKLIQLLTPERDKPQKRSPVFPLAVSWLHVPKPTRTSHPPSEFYFKAIFPN